MQRIIVFLTQKEIFGRNVIGDNISEGISINGSTSIMCRGKEHIDEFTECLLDQFQVRSFEDEDFDITILECNADKELMAYLCEACRKSVRMNVISIDKVLPSIVLNKKKVPPEGKMKVEFASDVYCVSCDKDGVVSVQLDRKEQDEDILGISQDDFNFLYSFSTRKIKIGVDEEKLKEKENEIDSLKLELANMKKLFDELKPKDLYPGAVVSCTITDVDSQGVSVSFYCNHFVSGFVPVRHEGLIPWDEWEANANPKVLMNNIKVGDVVDSVIISDSASEKYAFMIDERISNDADIIAAPIAVASDSIRLSKVRFSQSIIIKKPAPDEMK